jgi:tetratricopeptide (TPR) repeat protein
MKDFRKKFYHEFLKKNYIHMKPINKMRSSLGVVLVAALVLFTYGCDDFLDVPAKGSLSEDVLADEQGVETLLIGAYAALDGAGISGNPWEAAGHNWIYGSVVGGDAHKGTEAGDQSAINPMMRGQFLPTEGFFNTFWRVRYEGISRSNATLRVAANVEGMPEQERLNVVAQARFLRGHYYFDLTRMFNEVPWIDEETDEFNQPNDRVLWPEIEADFQFAFDNLPETQGQRARANKWAAGAYLGKVYLYQGKYQEAKNMFDQVIASGVTAEGVPYDLANGYWDNWNPALESGLPEAVFFVQQVANDGSGTINNANQGMMLNFPNSAGLRCCGFYQPTHDLVNSYRTEGGLPILDGFNDEMVTSDLGVASDQQFQPYEGEVDPRLDWNVGRRGMPYHDWGPFPGERWVRNQAYGGPYHAKKNVYWQSQEQFADNSSWAPGTAINIPIIRFADVLLMSAEADIEVGNLESARQKVNRVRERAARPDTWVSNDLNRGYAFAIVGTESEVTDETGITAGQWVVVEDTQSTYTFLGGDPTSLANWNRYDEANYNISLYNNAWTDANVARDAVRLERRIELAMEGHRFYDLVRWGIAQEEMTRFYNYEGNLFPANGFEGGQFRNEYFPIPQDQIDLSQGLLEQNSGY